MPNPCIYKSVCKECKMCDADDRPLMCISLRCEYYTPCTKCHCNRTLNDKKICNVCAKDQRTTIATNPEGKLIEVPVSHQVQMQSSDEGDIPHREVSITQPGTPPSEYSEGEKEYYLAQWNEYRNFYRDPTAKALCHNIIIMEIELNYLVNYMINHRGQASKDHESQRNRIIKNLTELRNQLPQREATEQSDDERFISMVYDRYIEEKKKRSLGKVSRVLSPEALALAPALDFPVNPQQLLTDLGYRTVDAIQACQHITLEELPSNPAQTLEFFGYFLDEKYAMPYETKLEDEEPRLPDLEANEPPDAETTEQG